jgi:hypothetical protein
MRVLALAIDAGTEAEDAVKPFAVPPEPPKGSNWAFVGGLAARWQRRAMTTPGAEQTRRSCERLDEFAAAMADAASSADSTDLAEIAAAGNSWSDLLWASNTNGSSIYNDVRAALARLNKVRTNLILNRPIDD